MDPLGKTVTVWVIVRANKFVQSHILKGEVIELVRHASQVIKGNFVFKEHSTGLREAMASAATTHAKWDILVREWLLGAFGSCTWCSCTHERVVRVFMRALFFVFRPQISVRSTELFLLLCDILASH